jgi:hypothetical protein
MTARRAPRAKTWGRRKWLGYCLLLITAVAVLAVQWRGGAVARADLTSFQAKAGADAMRDTVVSPDAPLSSNVSDVGIPSAQALVDALGNSQAYAAFPYPGDTALSGPGLLSGIVGASLPSYPLIVSSSDPAAPDGSLDQGPVSLSAHSKPTTSTGSATVGQAAQDNAVGKLLATATAKADAVTGAVSGEATSDADLIDIAGVLRIGSLHATAGAARGADGKIAKSSAMAIGQVTVAGVAAQITDQGISIAGQGQALPATGAITDPLQAAGISVRVLQPLVTDSGVTSGGLEITQHQAASGHDVTHTYTFGRAHAQVFAVAAPALPIPVPLSSAAPTPGSSVPTPAATPVTSGSSSLAALPAVTGPAGPAGEPGPAVAQPVVTGQPATGQSNAASVAAVDTSTVAFARHGTTDLYLLLVVGGLVALGGGQLLRIIAVRRTWIS